MYFPKVYGPKIIMIESEYIANVYRDKDKQNYNLSLQRHGIAWI